ncbi:hypothetical protein PU560_03410, partial [Georgenia sp. 10Sc9-8]|nr:hypothetical protein [Georgenia halotolerans]
MPVLEESRSRRMAVARQALRRAEAATGVRARLAGPTVAAREAHPGPADPPAVVGSPAVGSPAVAGADGTGRATEATTGTTGSGTETGTTAAGPVLPVPAALRPVFPAGGLVRGSAVQVAGSTSLLLALAAVA